MTVKNKLHLTDDQVAEKEQKIAIEDAIINEFIEDSVALTIDPKAAHNSKYINARPEDQKGYNLIAFNIVSDSYMQEIEDNPRMEGIEFTNYLQLFNNKRAWQKDLQKPGVTKGDDAFLFSDIFNEDNGLFKAAALEGYRFALINQEDKPKV